ncbi:hypothetical protein ZYGR_0H03240 [Zygosaccharomyces rouxii]|uniref:ZYRO0B11550p n=2 Tax=Zygosaccharomyces rouxii TaxID=4956 RepID=C5DRV0_ZYGRC|nr:uncharacterized protein ZYRO0B11550g [Zygosaccharomyces rouxii]KAH9199959.1 SPT2 chromatin protein-domain-containing protein [Zygosaccharomyces rouxii]GAV47481.1 hypothetical protein ZYGR_0H03240 [Zygosaccharomyces rouxii]CAR26511.1 ZYRO0B11550p [Zygosaccharomyces rouxii]
MSFLSKISNLRKSIPVAPPKANTPSSQPETYQAPSLLPKSYTREEDPAVRRLKEKRQQELLKKGELSKKATASRRTSASGKGTKKDSDDDNKTVTRFKKKSSSGSSTGSNRPTHISVAQKKKPEPVKKMSFDELMKQAENNAHSNGSSSSKSGSTTPVRAPSETQPRPRPHINKPGFKNPDRRRRAGSQEPVKPVVKNQPTPTVKEPRPAKLSLPKKDFAKPNELIRRRLEAKKNASRVQETQQDDYESDMDDFIEDDEEEDRVAMEKDPGYDRDEIWALFNRGKRRSDYAFDDDEEDDMEANEMEIIEEEERARKMARLEDKREEAWLKKHEMEKKKRKKARD